MRSFALALVVGLCACGEGPPPNRMLSTDGGSLTYFVQTDSFDGTDQFEWNVTTQPAQVFVRFDGTGLTHGSVQVSFLDATGHPVFSASAAANEDAPASKASSQGAPGPWTVRLDFSSATGIIAFTAVPSH